MPVEYDHKRAEKGTVVRVGLKPPSSNYSICKCPFCAAQVQAFWWSLSGGGKKCDCGAKLDSGLDYAPPKGKVYDPDQRKFVKEKK